MRLLLLAVANDEETGLRRSRESSAFEGVARGSFGGRGCGTGALMRGPVSGDVHVAGVLPRAAIPLTTLSLQQRCRLCRSRPMKSGRISGKLALRTGPLTATGWRLPLWMPPGA
jgi:hypothetical protein